MYVVDSYINSLSNSTFVRNGGSKIPSGGAICLYNSEANIVNSTFQLNIAIKGGAISFEWDCLDVWQLILTENHFIDNKATEQGGAITYNFINPLLLQNYFRNNTADYGDNLASYPVRIGLENSLKDDIIIWPEVGSGIILDEEIKLALFDYDDQIITIDQSSQIIILPKNQTQARIGGTNAVVVKNGVATFNGLYATSEPGSKNVLLLASSTSIDISKVDTAFQGSVIQHPVRLNFRFCQPGERIISNEWSPCSTGTYSLEWNSTVWEKWEDHSIWLDGSLRAEKGYWRRTNTTKFIIEWINKDACLGGVDEEGKIDYNTNKFLK